MPFKKSQTVNCFRTHYYYLVQWFSNYISASNMLREIISEVCNENWSHKIYDICSSVRPCNSTILSEGLCLAIVILGGHFKRWNNHHEVTFLCIHVVKRFCKKVQGHEVLWETLGATLLHRKRFHQFPCTSCSVTTPPSHFALTSLRRELVRVISVQERNIQSMFWNRSCVVILASPGFGNLNILQDRFSVWTWAGKPHHHGLYIPTLFHWGTQSSVHWFSRWPPI